MDLINLIVEFTPEELEISKANLDILIKNFEDLKCKFKEQVSNNKLVSQEINTLKEELLLFNENLLEKNNKLKEFNLLVKGNKRNIEIRKERIINIKKSIENKFKLLNQNFDDNMVQEELLIHPGFIKFNEEINNFSKIKEITILTEEICNIKATIITIESKIQTLSDSLNSDIKIKINLKNEKKIMKDKITHLLEIYELNLIIPRYKSYFIENNLQENIEDYESIHNLENQLIKICNDHYQKIILEKIMTPDTKEWWIFNNNKYYLLDLSEEDIQSTGSFVKRCILYSDYINYAQENDIDYIINDLNDLIIKVNNYHQEYLKEQHTVYWDEYSDFCGADSCDEDCYWELANIRCNCGNLKSLTWDDDDFDPTDYENFNIWDTEPYGWLSSLSSLW